MGYLKHFPHYKQHNASDCGPTSLRMIDSTLESKSFCCLIQDDKNGHRFWIADPGKGKYKLSLEEFSSLWVSTKSSQCDKGIAMFTYGNGETMFRHIFF